MLNIRFKRFSFLHTSLFISSLLCSSLATASPAYYPKPDLPREKNMEAAEFGHAIARKGKYTLVGSDRNSEFSSVEFNGQADGNRNWDHGAIYLMADDNSEQPKKYQFLKDTASLSASNSSYMGAIQNFGSAVAISDNYLAATIKDPIQGASGSHIALIPKINGSFPSCPSAPYIVGSKVWSDYKSFVNCSSLIGGVGQVFNDKINLISLPSDFAYGLRTAKLRVDGDIVVIAKESTLYAWGASYVRYQSGRWWRQVFSFTPDAGKKISDIALSNGRLAIGVTSVNGPANDTTGEVLTYTMDFINIGGGNAQFIPRSTGILSNGMVGFARTLAMNSDTLMVGSGSKEYTPNTSSSMPLSVGYVQQYRYSEAEPETYGWGNFWIPKDNRLYSSTPITLKMDENTLVVQLQEMTIPLSGTANYYYPYCLKGPDPTKCYQAMANIYFRSTTGEKLFDHGFGIASKRTITKQSLIDARPWYYLWEQMTFVDGTKGLDTAKPEVIPENPIDVSNGNVVVGWKGAKYRVDNYQERQELQSRPDANPNAVNGYVGLNGGFFLEKTNSLEQ